MGDLLLITPAIRAIRALHPKAHIALFVGEWSRASIEGNPNIDEIISYPDNWIQGKKPFRILQLVWRLRKKRFDRVYIFHSHNILHLLTLLAGIPERYGFRFRGTGKLLTRSAEWQPNISRYIADNYLDIPRLAGYSGSDLSLEMHPAPEDEQSALEVLDSAGVKDDGFVIMAPGGGINPRQDVFEKRWGGWGFARLAENIAEEYNSDIVLVGAPGENGLCRQITEDSRTGIINLCGKTSFRQSAALVKHARLLISNDSSLMHTAVAFGTRSLSIFGPSNPESLLPVSDRNRWITSGLDCSPCYCNSIFEGCSNNLRCMEELSPQRVFETVKELLVEQPDAGIFGSNTIV